jgi:HlyD family secretion protein
MIDERSNEPSTTTIESSVSNSTQTSAPAPSYRPKKKKPKKGRRIAAVIVVLAIVLGGAAYYTLSLTKKPPEQAIIEAKVTKGNVQKMINASGPVNPIKQYTVNASVTGQILADYITKGQEIKKGDPLYTIDDTNAQSAIKQNEIALERAKLQYEESIEARQNLNVVTDVSGLVTNVYIKEGDNVMANSPVAQITDTTNLTLTLPFLSEDTKYIHVGDSAVVTLEASGASIDGTVTRVYTGKQISSTGSMVTSIDIACVNPGVIKSGDTATAIIEDLYACNASGKLSYASEKVVVAKTSGRVTKLDLRVGDSVKTGDSADSTVQTAALAVQNAESVLANSIDALKNYNLTSPIDGTVISKTSKAGDTIANTMNSGSMAVIADMSALILKITVDEYDILNIKTGMTANITADSQPGQFFTGVVTNVSTTGNSMSGSSSTFSFGGFGGTGVTNYEVEITIAKYGKLLPGMNVNASIVTQSAMNVLTVPQQAVQYGSYILKKIDPNAPATPSPSAPASAFGGMSSFMPKAPAGYEYVMVTVGLTDTMSAEIKSGLKEGDIIGYTISSMSSFGMFGGFGGMGMPSMGGF